MTESPYVPFAAVQLLHELYKATGHEATITRVNCRRWQLTLATDRVCLKVDFKSGYRGRVRKTKTMLEVDGKPRTLAKGIEHIAKVFRDPDAQDAIEPMPPLSSPSDVPMQIQGDYQRIARSIDDDKLTVQLGGQGSRWTIGLEGDNASLRLNYKPGRGRGWRANLQLVIDGQDYSGEVMNNLAKALELLGGKAPEGNAAQSINKPGGPAGTANSVSVRRATVIRN
jgi:hypothetical protein